MASTLDRSGVILDMSPVAEENNVWLPEITLFWGDNKAIVVKVLKYGMEMFPMALGSWAGDENFVLIAERE